MGGRSIKLLHNCDHVLVINMLRMQLLLFILVIASWFGNGMSQGSPSIPMRPNQHLRLNNPSNLYSHKGNVDSLANGDISQFNSEDIKGKMDKKIWELNELIRTACLRQNAWVIRMVELEKEMTALQRENQRMDELKQLHCKELQQMEQTLQLNRKGESNDAFQQVRQNYGGNEGNQWCGPNGDWCRSVNSNRRVNSDRISGYPYFDYYSGIEPGRFEDVNPQTSSSRDQTTGPVTVDYRSTSVPTSTQQPEAARTPSPPTYDAIVPQTQAQPNYNVQNPSLPSTPPPPTTPQTPPLTPPPPPTTQTPPLTPPPPPTTQPSTSPSTLSAPAAPAASPALPSPPTTSTIPAMVTPSTSETTPSRPAPSDEVITGQIAQEAT